MTETNVKIANEVAYYPFLISHPKSSMVYRLSTSSKEDRDSWVAALNGLINKTTQSGGDSAYIYAPSGSIDATADATPSSLLALNSTKDLEGDKEEGVIGVENAAATLTHIPPHCREQVCSCAYNRIDRLWIPLPHSIYIYYHNCSIFLYLHSLTPHPSPPYR